MEHETVVIFRKWPKSEGGDVIALFPYDPGTYEPHTCNSYEHLGQHGAADPNLVVSLTKPATLEEYAELKTELESKPYNYNLTIYQRIPSGAIGARRKQIEEMR